MQILSAMKCKMGKKMGKAAVNVKIEPETIAIGQFCSVYVKKMVPGSREKLLR